MYKFTRAGVMIANDGTTAADKASIAKNVLHARYIRFTAISMATWSGSSPSYEAYRDSGLIPLPVIDVGATTATLSGWITNSTTPNRTTLKTNVDAFLTKYPEIRLIFLDNEEMNPSYHSGTVEQYVDIANDIQDVCNKHNVLLASGGVGNFYPIHAFIFRYVKEAYGQAKADAFAKTVFLNGTLGNQYKVANGTATDATLEGYITKLETVYYSDAFDVWNFHMYEPTGDQTNASSASVANDLFWRYAYEAFTEKHPNKRRFIACNEWGPRETTNGAIVSSVLDSVWKAGFLIFVVWSGNGIPLKTHPLTSGGIITSLGTPFLVWSDGHYETVKLP